MSAPVSFAGRSLRPTDGPVRAQVAIACRFSSPPGEHARPHDPSRGAGIRDESTRCLDPAPYLRAGAMQTLRAGAMQTLRAGAMQTLRAGAMQTLRAGAMQTLRASTSVSLSRVGTRPGS